MPSQHEQMTGATDLLAEAFERPFASTYEKYNAEYAKGSLNGSNFPYHEVHSLPGYVNRKTPGFTGVDATNELARHLADYAERNGCRLPYRQREISHYLWIQASRGMLVWEEILRVVRATRKRQSQRPIAYDYFGYKETIREVKGTAKDKRLIKLTRYISQEGECAGCRTEFQFDDLTLDRIRPGNANGTYNLRNVQLMCQHCNCAKGSTYC